MCKGFKQEVSVLHAIIHVLGVHWTHWHQQHGEEYLTRPISTLDTNMEVSVLPELDVVPEWQLTGAKGNDGGRSRPDGAGDRGEPCDGKLVLVTAHERLVVTMERQHPGREAIQERRGVSSGAPGAETGGTQRLEQGTDIVLCRYGKARTRRCKFLLKPTGAIF